MTKEIHGIIPAVLTPFDESGTHRRKGVSHPDEEDSARGGIVKVAVGIPARQSDSVRHGRLLERVVGMRKTCR